MKATTSSTDSNASRAGRFDDDAMKGKVINIGGSVPLLTFTLREVLEWH